MSKIEFYKPKPGDTFRVVSPIGPPVLHFKPTAFDADGQYVPCVRPCPICAMSRAIRMRKIIDAVLVVAIVVMLLLVFRAVFGWRLPWP